MPSQSLSIRFLGEIEVVRAGVRQALPPSKKTRALLAYLAVTCRAHRRERLCAMFWEIPDDPRGSLRWSLSKLRPLVDRPDRARILADRETVAFDDWGVWIDVLALRERLSGGPDALSTEELEALAEGYSGAFLEGLELSSCPDFHAWCVAEREELRALQAGVRRALVTRLAAEPEAALPHARALVELDGFEVEARAGLLRLLLESGRRREAEEQYRAAARQLGEVGADAADAIARAWRELRRPAVQNVAARIARPDPPVPVSVGAPAPARPAPRTEPAASAPVAEQADSAVLGVPSAERKHLTVLSAHLQGAAQSLADLDPELLIARLDPALRAMAEAVTRYGGTISRMAEDGLMALFGAPVAHEDHAVRACHAALAMQEAVRAASDGALVMRAGIHSGEAVVRARTGDPNGPLEAVGAVAHLAARLESTVGPGAIGLTAATWRQVEGFFTAQRRGAVRLPEVAAPVELLELAGRSAAHGSWQARAGRGLTRFVGREAELAMLLSGLERAAGGLGQLVAVVGDPGIGKSRLVHELAARAVDRGWTVLEASASPYHTHTTYHPIGAMLRSWCGVEMRDSPAEIAGKVERAVLALDPELRVVLPALLAVLDLPVDDPGWRLLSPAQRRRRILDHLKALLVRLSREAPLLLLVEDLHWIDDQSQALLDALVDGIAAAPMLLVATHRPEYRHGWSGRSAFSQIRLNPLPSAGAEALLSSLLGDDPGLLAVRRLLVESTDGTPLFLEESVRELVETGVLAGERGAYRLVRPIEGYAMPPSVRAVLAARIDRLPPGHKGLLQVAAVIGRTVPFDLLQAVAPLSEAELRDHLDALQAAELLYETRQIPVVEHSFKHALTHEVAYNSVLRERRRAVHVDLVRAIEERHAERLGEQVERLAYHALAGELPDKAVGYLFQAAGKAIHRSAHRQALEHLRRGLALLAEMPETEERLRLELDYQNALGVTWMAAKGWGAQEVSDAYSRAREICERLGDDRQLFTVLRGQGQFHMIRGELNTARALGNRCLELARATADQAVRIETHHLFWSNSFFMGDYANAELHSGHGIALYERDRDHGLTYVYSGHDPGVCCRCFSALILWQKGHADRALARCREAMALADDVAHPLTTALAQWAFAYVHLFRREPEPALAFAEDAIALCREYLLPLLLSQAMFQSGWALAALGRLDEGIARMEEGLEAIRATGAEMGLPYFIALLGEARARAGDIGAGLALVEQAIATANRNGARFVLSEMLRLKGELMLAASGDADAAGACLVEAIRIAGAQGALLPQLRAGASLARLLLAQGERPAAEILLRPLLDGLIEGGDTPDLRDARALLGAA